MEKVLTLQLNSNNKFSTVSGDENLGFEGEHNATSIKIVLPQEVHGAKHFVEFIKPSGSVVSSGQLEETITESEHFISFGATNGLLDEQGRYILQYVGRKGSQDPKTIKSELKPLDVEPSVNAGVLISEVDADFISWATKEIALLRSALQLNGGKDLEQDQKDNSHDLAITSLQSKLNELESLVRSTVYSGVIFHGSETVGTHVGAASGLTLAEIRHLPVFRTIRSYVDNDGHHKWSVNKFYVKHVSAEAEGLVPGDEGWYEGWYVAESKIDDSWVLLPAFAKLHKEKIILGKYKAGVEGDDEETGILVSKPNLSPVNNYSPEVARDHMPENAHSMHFFEAQAIDILMWVSTGVRDLQRGFYKGDCFDPYLYPTDYDWLNSENSNKVYFPLSDLYDYTAFAECEDDDDILAKFSVGSKLTIWDDDEGAIIGEATITGIDKVTKHNENDDEDVDCLELTFAEPLPMEDYYIALLGSVFKTGLTDQVEGETGEETVSMDGCRHFKWFGLEDWYGCVYDWLEGVALVGIYNSTSGTTKTHVKYCTNPAFYPEANYQDGNAGAMSHWASALEFTAKNGGYTEEYRETSVKGLYIPYCEQNDSDDATYYADFAGVGTIGANSSHPVLSYLFYRGSDYSDGYSAGPGYLDGYDSTDTNGYIGFRLSYDEE